MSNECIALNEHNCKLHLKGQFVSMDGGKERDWIVAWDDGVGRGEVDGNGRVKQGAVETAPLSC